MEKRSCMKELLLTSAAIWILLNSAAWAQENPPTSSEYKVLENVTVELAIKSGEKIILSNAKLRIFDGLMWNDSQRFLVKNRAEILFGTATIRKIEILGQDKDAGCWEIGLYLKIPDKKFMAGYPLYWCASLIRGLDNKGEPRQVEIEKVKSITILKAE